MKNKIIYAPEKIEAAEGQIALFLAGSIEMGNAIDWQNQLVKDLEDNDLVILNPRRPDWDSSWEQKISNPKFKEQVTWELDGLCCADIIPLYLAPGTKSPISLLELGLFSYKRVVIYCPEGFWRKGNVDIVAERYDLFVTDNHEAWVNEIKREIKMHEIFN
jgi:hypothetical protein